MPGSVEDYQPRSDQPFTMGGGVMDLLFRDRPGAAGWGAREGAYTGQSASPQNYYDNLQAQQQQQALASQLARQMMMMSPSMAQAMPGAYGQAMGPYGPQQQGPYPGQMGFTGYQPFPACGDMARQPPGSMAFGGRGMPAAGGPPQGAFGDEAQARESVRRMLALSKRTQPPSNLTSSQMRAPTPSINLPSPCWTPFLTVPRAFASARPRGPGANRV